MTTKIIEIDDNNNSNVFHNSKLVNNAVSVNLRKGEEAFTDAIFEQMDSGAKIILDFGGGNDGKKGLKIIENFDVNFTYVIPVGNSLAQAQNAVDTYNLIKNKDRVIFALNQINDIKNLKNEWVFWFGSKELGLSSIAEKLGNPSTIFIPRSPLFEIAALIGLTISELADFARDIENPTKLFFEQSKGDKEIFKKLMSKHSQAKAAIRYTDSILPILKDSLQNVKNVAVISTKGGVGKSTIAWHLLPAVLREEEK